MIGAWIDEFEAAAATGRPFAPASAAAVGDLVHDDPDGVGNEMAAAVGGRDGVRHGEHDAVTAIAQSAAEIAQRVGLGILLTLMIVAVFNDIVRLIS